MRGCGILYLFVLSCLVCSFVYFCVATAFCADFCACLLACSFALCVCVCV